MHVHMYHDHINLNTGIYHQTVTSRDEVDSFIISLTFLPLFSFLDIFRTNVVLHRNPGKVTLIYFLQSYEPYFMHVLKPCFF